MCPYNIIVTSATVVTVAGVDTLLLNIPAGTYGRGCQYNLTIATTIPDTVTVNMPVAVSIGGVTTVAYPLVRCDGVQVTGRQIASRTVLKVKVATNNTSGVFRVLCGLYASPASNIASLPIPTPAAPAAPAGGEV